MRIFQLAALLLMLFGCASSGPMIETARLAELQKGKTTADEIVLRFGRPSFHSDNMDGTRTSAYLQPGNRSDTAAMLSLVTALAGGTSANVNSIIFRFDANGVLNDYERTTESPAANSTSTARAVTGNPIPSAATNSATRSAPVRPARETREDNLPGWLPATSSKDPRDPH